MWRHNKKGKKKKHEQLRRRRRKWRTGVVEWEVREEQEYKEDRIGRFIKMGTRQNTMLPVYIGR
jgi:hypothetical protein